MKTSESSVQTDVTVVFKRYEITVSMSHVQNYVAYDSSTPRNDLLVTEETILRSQADNDTKYVYLACASKGC
jgi:hypothetical protein